MFRVSAHLVIGRQGEAYQLVPFDKRAWHAGESEFEGRQRCNDFSIGIELIGPEEGPFTDRQYHSLATVCSDLCLSYAIEPAHIVGHRDTHLAASWIRELILISIRSARLLNRGVPRR